MGLIKYVCLFVFVLVFGSLKPQDPRDPFMGYYKGTLIKDYGISTDDTIQDYVLVFIKSLTNQDTISRKYGSETSKNTNYFYFDTTNLSFDDWPSNPGKGDYGYFYDNDSVYFTEYHVGSDGLRLYFRGKKFKEVSVSEVPAEDLLQLAPNPVQDILTVQVLWGSFSEDYTLCNLAGQQVQKGEVQNSQIPLAAIPPGVYLLHLNINDTPVVKRIVKE